jgi:hypothetical protein
MDLDREIDRLYTIPPNEFTVARNELAKRLKGDDDAATRVRSLEKPNAIAWTLNRLARRSPHDLEAFLDVGDQLRDAEHEALSGGGAAALRQAAANERRAVGGLVAEAERLAREDATKVTPAFTQKLGDTLRAAVVDPAARDALIRGRLTRDLQRVGFIEPAVPAGTRPARNPAGRRPADEADRRAREEDARARAESKERSDRLSAEARRATQALTRAERALQQAMREVDRLERDAAEAAQRVRDARQRLAAVKKTHREAERDAARTGTAADAAAREIRSR